MGRMIDANEMQLIYDGCIRVFNGEISANDASKMLFEKTNASEASLKMYFIIYSCMRKGTCYKMGTSASFTRFLIESIYRDNGKEALLSALASAKQNAEYRISCGNEQPGIEAVCRELISKYSLPVSYEELNQYYGETKPREAKKVNNKEDHTSKKNKGKKINISISYGGVSFKANGAAETVLQELQEFSAQILPKTVSALLRKNISTQKEDSKKTHGKQQKKKKTGKKGSQLSVGKRILKKHPEILKLTDKMDFKARMIPLLYLADEAKLQNIFSIHDIQVLMLDTIGESAEKKQIEDVFARRADWFEKVNQNPRKYKLLDIAKDYARNVLGE